MRYQIVSDGTAKGTTVTNPDTGTPVGAVDSVSASGTIESITIDFHTERSDASKATAADSNPAKKK